MEEEISLIYSRLSVLERQEAVSSVEYNRIKDDLSDIKSATSWLARLILSALVVAVMAFILSGGLAGAAIIAI